MMSAAVAACKRLVHRLSGLDDAVVDLCIGAGGNTQSLIYALIQSIMAASLAVDEGILYFCTKLGETLNTRKQLIWYKWKSQDIVVYSHHSCLLSSPCTLVKHGHISGA